MESDVLSNGLALRGPKSSMTTVYRTMYRFYDVGIPCLNIWKFESWRFFHCMVPTIVKASNHSAIRVTVLIALALSRAVSGQG